MKPILAVFGGSFNPPHIGHMWLAEYVLSFENVEKLLVVPARHHALKKSLAPFERRLLWLQFLFENFDQRLEISDIESQIFENHVPVFTVRLLDTLASKYPEYDVRLVVGSDITKSGETRRWFKWDRIVSLYKPIVVPRTGWTQEITSCPNVSSTVLREHIALGDLESIKDMTSQRILEDIRKKGSPWTSFL